ncbi:MAG: polyhydroxyalkanoate synthesis repressor PhaR [Pseudomonadota bacterium]
MAEAKRGGKRASNTDKGSSDRVVIKKYANRRLYNTARSTYVTLDDLATMVRDGDDFAVFDAKSGEDITRSVLTQIIFEEEAKGQSMLPTNFLRQLIRLYGDTLQTVVPSYLDASMEAFAKNQERMRQTFGNNPAMQNFEALTRKNMEMFEQAVRMFTPFTGKPGGEGANSVEQKDGSANAAEDLEALQRQIREMQSRIEKMSDDRS